jgi:Mce-associated membrane protein
VTPPVSGSGSDESDAAPDEKTESSTTEKETTAVPVETAAAADEADQAEADDDKAATAAKTPVTAKRGTDWSRVLAYGILPGLALLLALGAGFLKWEDASVRASDVARTESVRVAKDATIKLLSYKPDTVEQDLTSARDLLTGDFRDSYTQLTTDVVIPGSKQKQISAVASVPAVASVSADPSRAVVLVFVNQTVVVGADAPTATASSVQVTLVKENDHWLISKFDPV